MGTQRKQLPKMSHLLQCPRELRDEIYKLVLGTCMVHLISEELSWTTTVESVATNKSLDVDETVYSDDLYCERCTETITEQEAYQISQILDPHDPYGTMPGVSKDRCRYCRRHNQCTRGWKSIPWNGNPKHGSVETIHPKSYGRTALLRVARTVHHEASAILCANTIFSFKLAHTLTVFTRNLAPLQRHAVKSIHLEINLDPDFPEHDIWSWHGDDLRGTLASLPGLRDLRLTIKQSCQGYFRAFLEKLQDESLNLWKNDLTQFRRSSLRNVAVIVEDIDSTVLQEWNGTGPEQLQQRLDYLVQEGHWTMAERAEYARVLRDKLLGI